MVSSNSHLSELMHDPQFVKVWSIGICRGICQWLEMLVAGIFAFELTGSPFMVALLFVARLFPLTVLGLVIGTLADRTSHRFMLIVCFIFASTTSFLIFVILTSGYETYWVILIASVSSGIVWSNDMPVRRRLLGDVAGKDRIVSAMGLDAATNHATRLLGPLIGGFLYQYLGAPGAYALTAVLYLIAVFLAIGLSSGASVVSKPGNLLNIKTEIYEGFAFLTRHRDVQRFLLVTIAFNIWGFPFVTMVPVIGVEQLSLSPGWIGVLASMEAAGALIGCVFIASSMLSSNQRQFYYLGTILYVVFAFIAGWIINAWWMAAVFICIGLSQSGFSTMQSALVYAIAPPGMRSRLFGLLVICIGSGLLGMMNMGLLGEWLGGASAVRIVALEGVVALVLIGIGWPQLRERQPVNDSNI